VVVWVVAEKGYCWEGRWGKYCWKELWRSVGRCGKW